MTASAIREARARPAEFAKLTQLFELLKRSAFDGIGISRLAYSDKESEALDIIADCSAE